MRFPSQTPHECSLFAPLYELLNLLVRLVCWSEVNSNSVIIPISNLLESSLWNDVLIPIRTISIANSLKLVVWTTSTRYLAVMSRFHWLNWMSYWFSADVDESEIKSILSFTLRHLHLWMMGSSSILRDLFVNWFNAFVSKRDDIEQNSVSSSIPLADCRHCFLPCTFSRWRSTWSREKTERTWDFVRREIGSWTQR